MRSGWPESDVFQFSGLNSPGQSSADEVSPPVDCCTTIWLKKSVPKRVGALQPEMVFGDVADEIAFR